MLYNGIVQIQFIEISIAHPSVSMDRKQDERNYFREDVAWNTIHYH